MKLSLINDTIIYDCTEAIIEYYYSSYKLAEDIIYWLCPFVLNQYNQGICKKKKRKSVFFSRVLLRGEVGVDVDVFSPVIGPLSHV